MGGKPGATIASLGKAYVDAGLDSAKTPSVHLTHVHRAAFQTAAKPPFEASRAVMRDAAIRLVQHAEREMAGATDPAARFAIASRWAAAATHLDPRAAGLGPEAKSADEFAEDVRRVAAAGVAVDDTAEAFELLKKARNVLFIHDGVGELSLDRLLASEILRHARRVFSVASGAPLGGRATLDDLHRAGLAEVATELIPMGPGEIGLVWEEASADVKGKLEIVDLVIAKGQANVYALHEREKEILKPMFCLFRTMCDPVAEVFGGKGRLTVLKLWK